MDEIGLNHKPKRKPNGITKADKEAHKSDDLIKRDFTANKPIETCPHAFASSVVMASATSTVHALENAIFVD